MNKSSNPPARGQTSFVVFISMLASVYVVTRLWTSSLEVSMLHRELDRLHHEQMVPMTTISQSEIDQPCIDEDAFFYSIRPAPADGIEIPPLQGVKLADDTLTTVSGDGTMVGQLERIEDATIFGWTCWRSEATKDMQLRIYIDGILVTTGISTGPLPEHAIKACRIDDSDTNIPDGSAFSVQLPPLDIGSHEVRAFMTPSVEPTFKQQVYGSPLKFKESTIQPDAVERIRRKDAIITMRNAELAKLWTQVHTALPWKVMEAQHAKASQHSSDDAIPSTTAAIAILSEPRARGIRDIIRKTWASPSRLEKANMKIMFVTGKSYNKLDEEHLEAEIAQHHDIVRVDIDESSEQLPRRALAAIAALTETIEAQFYFKTKDTVIVDLQKLATYLDAKISSGNNLYLGCFKSGLIVSDQDAQWYEPDHLRFGDSVCTEDEDDGKQYPKHATHEFYGFSRPIARYLTLNRAVLHTYAYEDTSMGAWLLGLDVQNEHDKMFCSSDSLACEEKESKNRIAFYDSRCSGVCHAGIKLEALYQRCVSPL